MCRILRFLIVICSQLATISTENILIVLPIATRSHKNIFDPLVLGLASRGHSVTVLSPLPSRELPPNVKEIVPAVKRGSFKDEFKLNPLEMRGQGSHTKVLFFGIAMDQQCVDAYEHPEVQQLIAARPRFDVVIIDAYFNQCFWGLAPHFNAPLILLTPMASPMFITKFTGNYHPTSFVPLPYLGLSDKMNFLECAWNLIGSYWGVYLNDRKNPQNEAFYRKYLGNQSLPGVEEIGFSVSLILSNENHVVSYPRSNLPDTVPIGGIHCRPPRPITDKKLFDFVNGAEHGFIFFSLGTILKPDHLPEATIRMFTSVFSRLKQHVVWKWEVETIPVPGNVMIRKWMPQQDLLGHPRMKLFITHGGLLSTMESAFHGVPLLGIPILLDQDLNMHHAESQGYALKLEILHLTEEQFETSIQRLLSEPQFAEKAKQLSTLFRDQVQSPLERGIFWTEYVMRHKGAVHLRSAARELYVLQTHSLDVLGFLGLILSSLLYILYWMLGKIVRKLIRICSRRKTKKKAE